MPREDSELRKQLSESWLAGELLKQYPSPSESLDRALLSLSSIADRFMEAVRLSNYDLALVCFCWPDDVYRALKYMKGMGLIDLEGDDNEGADVFITPQGWLRVSELRRPNQESKQAFVAMWFNDKTEETFTKGIGPGVEAAGYKPRKIDNKEHNNKICDEIVAEIRRSRFVVADFTAGLCGKCDSCEEKEKCELKVRPRGGVYFEAGFALGMNIPVIWTVRRDQIDQVHFDTRQYNYITYDSPEELCEKLHKRIDATIH
jgi:hypothetical protein